MRDRQMIETILARRFPGSTPGQIAAATNAIMALDEPSDALHRNGRGELNECAGTKNGTSTLEEGRSTDLKETSRGRRS